MRIVIDRSTPDADVMEYPFATIEQWMNNEGPRCYVTIADITGSPEWIRLDNA